jgi:5-aminolevulinate synthase
VHIEALTQALVETWKALDLPFSGLVLEPQERVQTVWKKRLSQ